MPTSTPSSTYRLHLTSEFTLADATDLVDHIDALGVDWLYLSPIQQVPEAATHGYHITDPGEVDPQLGGDDALRALAEAAVSHDRGMVLDIVPNHLAASPDNAWWDDLLRHGPDSAHATTFDIDLGTEDDPRPIVLPVLGEPVDEVLAAGDIRVEGDRLTVYDDLSLPLAPGTDPAAPIQEVLDAQHYRLRHWKAGERQLNYRRFFAINDLVGVRVEDPEVFTTRHQLVFGLLADGTLQGLRIDHIDGLADPGAYLQRLRDEVGDDTWVVVEKILDQGEDLRSDWPVAGTTGYEIAALLNAWLTDADGYRRLRNDFESRTSLTGPVTHALAESKYHVLNELFVGEVDAISRLLGPVEGVDDHDVAHVLVDMAAHLHGYRTYAPVDGPIPPQDERTIADTADAAAVTHGRRTATAVLDALTSDAGRPALIRWQQLTGPAAAKGFEDRLLYRHVALSSLCEVGVDAATLDELPEPAEVVQALAARQEAWPTAGTTTSTHDTKRSEDVRARISALAEVPESFIALIDHLTETVDDITIDPHARWLMTQTILGVLGLCTDDATALTARLQEYAVKALREAEVHTSHREPDEAYEAQVAQWIAAVTTREDAVVALQRLADRIAVAGVSNSLATVALKLTGPGVPDIYRGTEIIDDSLVDPDNRRPLEVDRLRAAATAVDEAMAHDDPSAAVAALREQWQDGSVKLLVTRAGLRLRRAHPALFAGGPLSAPHADGTAADHVVALRRGPDAAGTTVLTVATRLPSRLAGPDWPIGEVWGGTSIDTGERRSLTDVLTGAVHTPIDGRLRMADVLSTLPTAILVTNDES